MSKFLNEYTCYRCRHNWQDEWDCIVDDDCPKCGARHCSPEKSEEIEQQDYLVEILAKDDATVSKFVARQTDHDSAIHRGLEYIEKHGLPGCGVVVSEIDTR